MSTKMTLKYIAPENGKPGAHLYEDPMNYPDDTVVLRLDGVQLAMRTDINFGASVSVAIPYDLAHQLGLLEAKQ